MFFIFQTSLILNLFIVNNAAFVFPQLKSQTVKKPPTQQFSSSEAGTMIVTLIYFILYQRNSLRNSWVRGGVQWLKNVASIEHFLNGASYGATQKIGLSHLKQGFFITLLVFLPLRIGIEIEICTRQGIRTNFSLGKIEFSVLSLWIIRNIFATAIIPEWYKFKWGVKTVNNMEE